MIDSGATENYVSRGNVERQHLTLGQKRYPYRLTLADGTPVKQDDGWIRQQVQLDQLCIDPHQECITLDAVSIDHDLILGMPWLVKHNPDVNWIRRSLTFPQCECTDVPVSETDKARPEDATIAATVSDCPPEYKQFSKLLEEGEPEKSLPKRKPWDHEIPLEPGTKSTYRSIYSSRRKS